MTVTQPFNANEEICQLSFVALNTFVSVTMVPGDPCIWIVVGVLPNSRPTGNVSVIPISYAVALPGDGFLIVSVYVTQPSEATRLPLPLPVLVRTALARVTFGSLTVTGSESVMVRVTPSFQLRPA